MNRKCMFYFVKKAIIFYAPNIYINPLMTIKYCLNIQVDKLTLSFMYIDSTTLCGIKDRYRGVNSGQNLLKSRGIDSEE